jgi:hypothetical protein
MKHHSFPQKLGGLIVALIAVPAMAQYPASNQVGQVDKRVGGELYGNNSNGLTLRPYQVRLLPSEERFAIERSGMLPSELELNRSAVGPLSPNGVLDYITPRSSLERAMHDPEPQLYNPAYDLTLEPLARRGNAVTAKPGFENSVMPQRRSEPTARPLPSLTPSNIEALPNGELPTGQLPSGRLSSRPEVLPKVHTVVHTVRQGTLPPPRHSTTQPTPPPQPQQPQQ